MPPTPRRNTRQSDAGDQFEDIIGSADPRLRKELESTFNDSYFKRKQSSLPKEPTPVLTTPRVVQNKPVPPPRPLQAQTQAQKKAPAGTKRVKGKRISRPVIIGSEAWPLDESNRPPGIPEEHTTGWRVYVKNVEGGPDIRTWLQKVQFKIYPTYPNPNRMVDKEENQTFQLRETGWGGFNVDVRLYFQSVAHEKPQYRVHFLQLEPYGSVEQQSEQKGNKLIRSEICDYIEFNEPTEAFFDALTSDNQWDYERKDKGKGKKGAGTFGHGRSVDLAETTTKTNPYTKEHERSVIAGFKKAEESIEELISEEAKKREELAKRAAALKEEEKRVLQELEAVRAAKREANGVKG